MEGTIYSLCDDILIEIFSCIDTEHLIVTVYEVCEHWKYLISQDSRIWKNRWLKWNLSRSVGLINSYLNRAPLLDRLKLTWVPNLDFDGNTDLDTVLALKDVCKSPQILMLEIHLPITVDILQFINPNLMYLHATNICSQDYCTLKLFKNIESLNLGNAYDFCGQHLRIIADHCNKIKTVYLGDCRSLTSSDVIYFLEKRKKQLERLEINGYGLSDEVFVLMPYCKNLRKLQIHDSRLMSYSTFIDILYYSYIQDLHLSRIKHKCDIPASLLKKKNINILFED